METIAKVTGILLILYLIILALGCNGNSSNSSSEADVSEEITGYRHYVDDDIYYAIEGGNTFYLEFKSENGGWFGAAIMTISNGCKYVYSYGLEGNILDLDYVGSECGGSGTKTTMTIHDNRTITTIIKGQKFTFRQDEIESNEGGYSEMNDEPPMDEEGYTEMNDEPPSDEEGYTEMNDEPPSDFEEYEELNNKDQTGEEEANLIMNTKRDPNPRKDQANVFWKRQYTLFDFINDEPISPKTVNGKIIYNIYYSSNEDPRPYNGEFTEDQLESLLMYKFKTLESCEKFCSRRKK